MDFVTVDLNNINVGENNFNDDDRINIIYVRLIVWFDRYKQRKVCKTNRQRINASSMESVKMMVWCMPKDKKKRLKSCGMLRVMYKGW